MDTLTMHPIHLAGDDWSTRKPMSLTTEYYVSMNADVVTIEIDERFRLTVFDLPHDTAACLGMLGQIDAERMRELRKIMRHMIDAREAFENA